MHTRTYLFISNRNHFGRRSCLMDTCGLLFLRRFLFSWIFAYFLLMSSIFHEILMFLQCICENFFYDFFTVLSENKQMFELLV